MPPPRDLVFFACHSVSQTDGQLLKHLASGLAPARSRLWALVKEDDASGGGNLGHLHAGVPAFTWTSRRLFELYPAMLPVVNRATNRGNSGLTYEACVSA